jgi:hypothetical protein
MPFAQEMSRRGAGVLLAGATLLALALRVVAIGHESVWIDEAVSLRLAASSVGDLVSGAARDEGNPWGYWVLLHFWREWFGPTIEAARMLSAVLGSLIAPATFLLARSEGVSRATSLWAALAAGVAPPLLFLGREARVYAIFAVVAALTCVAAAAVRQGRRFGYLWFVVSAIALVYLHYYAFFVLGALGFALVWERWSSVKHLLSVGASYLAIGLAFLPSVPLFLKQLGAGSTRSAETWLLHLGAYPLYAVAGHTLVWKRSDHLTFVAVYLVVVVAIVLPVIYGLVRAASAPVVSTAVTIGTPALVALASLRSPILNSRYMSVAVPAVMVVLVVGIAALFRRWPRLAAATAAATAILMGASLYRLYTQPHLPDWRGVATAVAASDPSLPVFFYDDTGNLPFMYYRPELDRHVIMPVFSDATWEEKGVFAKMAAQPRGFWIALYLPYAKPGELDELTGRLRARFGAAQVQDFLGIRLIRLGPAA